MTVGLLDLGINGPDEAWKALSLCSQTDPELFFPEEGRSSKPAKRVCASCPVLAQRRAWTQGLKLRLGVQKGVYAGLSDWERQRELPSVCRFEGCTDPARSAAARYCAEHNAVVRRRTKQVSEAKRQARRAQLSLTS